MTYLKFTVICCLAASFQLAHAQSKNTVGNFSKGIIKNWEAAEFSDIPQSTYQLVDLDGRKVLRGRCNASASVFGLEQQIDLNATPIMHWSWRVDSVYKGINEKTKAGDDYVARVYAVVDGGILKWRTRAINYVWASSVPAGSAFPNPYRDEAMMVALQSGTKGAGQWHQESRNVKADFKKFYDKDTDVIDGIALMTDCDNHKGTGQAYFGDVYFTAE